MTSIPFLTPLLWAFALWVFYLAYVTLWVAKHNGKLDSTPRIVKALCFFTLGIGIVLDVGFNIVVASVIFMEPPTLAWLTFTARCAKWRQDQGYRGRLARWVCDGWLNPFQEHHC